MKTELLKYDSNIFILSTYVEAVIIYVITLACVSYKQDWEFNALIKSLKMLVHLKNSI